VDDALQVVQRGRVGKDDLPKGRPIQGPTGASQRLTEPGIDRLHLRCPRGKDGTRDDIGVDGHDVR